MRQLAPQPEQLGDDRPVARQRAVEEAAFELLPQVAPAGVLEERVVVGVGERDAIGPVSRSGREPPDVVLGQAIELLARQVEAVLPLVDVALEGHLELDDPAAQATGLGALLGGQVLTGPPEIAQKMVEQTALLAVQLAGRIRFGICPNRARQVFAAGQRRLPRSNPCLGGLAGVSNGGLRMNAGHEGASARSRVDQRVSIVDRLHGPLERGRRGGRSVGQQQICGGDGFVGQSCNPLGRDRSIVEAQGTSSE